MSHATDYALQGVSRAAAVARLTWFDLLRGAVIASRALLMAVGVAALAVGAAAVGHAPLRDQLTEQLPSIWAAVQPAKADAAPEQATAVAEPPALAVGDATAAHALTAREQNHVTQYLARRYRVADEAMRNLVAAAYRSAVDLQLDPQLILAVMAVESAFNPFAESSAGAQGLMQVMTHVHSRRFVPHGGDHAALDPIANIQVGSTILKELIKIGGSVERGLQLYVGAGNLPDDGGYAQKIMTEKNRIALAAAGRVDAALRGSAPPAPPAASATPTAAQPAEAKPKAAPEA
ncbi:MAG: transglycosylase SLT domain-containing protein [Betaproteobacteria bacterium]